MTTKKPAAHKTRVLNAAQSENDRLEELRNRYGIPPDDMKSLAMALAKTYVPGFEEKTPSARPTKWTVLQDVALAGCLWLAAHDHPTLNDNARSLVGMEPWKTMLNQGAWKKRASKDRDMHQVLLKRYRTMPPVHGIIGVAYATLYKAGEDPRKAWLELLDACSNDRCWGYVSALKMFAQKLEGYDAPLLEAMTLLLTAAKAAEIENRKSSTQ